MTDDTKVTLHFPGHEPIETTTGAMKKATKALKKGKIKLPVPGTNGQATQEHDAADVPGIGHNSDGAKETGGVAGKRLLSFIERVERLEGEIGGLKDDVKDVYAEAKGVGFDTKTIRRIIKERKMSVEKRREEDELLELYKSAIGMA